MDNLKDKTDTKNGFASGGRRIAGGLTDALRAWRERGGVPLAVDLFVLTIALLLSRCHVIFGSHPLGLALIAVLPNRVWAATAGAVIGGTDFLANRRHGATFFESVSAAAHSHRNQRFIEDNEDKKNGGDGTFPDKPDNDPNGDGSGGGSPTNGTDVQAAAKGDGNDTPPTTGDTQNSETTLPMSATKPENDTATDKTDNTAKPTTEESEDVSQAAEKGKVTFGAAVKGTTRLATLPAGVLKDLIQGGVIVAGKNFIPRVRNVMKGQSIVNHADVKKTVKKDMEKETDKK